MNNLWDKKAYQDGYLFRKFPVPNPQRVVDNLRSRNFIHGGLKVPIIVPTITAGNWKHYTLDDSELRAFRNFDFINGFSVDNNNNTGAVKIKLDHSPNRVYLIPKLSLKTYANMNFKAISIYSADGFTEGDVYLTPMISQPDRVNVVGAR